MKSESWLIQVNLKWYREHMSPLGWSSYGWEKQHTYIPVWRWNTRWGAGTRGSHAAGRVWWGGWSWETRGRERTERRDGKREMWERSETCAHNSIQIFSVLHTQASLTTVIKSCSRGNCWAALSKVLRYGPYYVKSQERIFGLISHYIKSKNNIYVN